MLITETTFLAQRLPTATCQVMGLGVGDGSGISQHYKLEQITNEVSNLYCFFFCITYYDYENTQKIWEGKHNFTASPSLIHPYTEMT